MPSPSSQQKSDSDLSRDDVSTLLRDGAAIRQPSQGILRAAKVLESLGLLTNSVRQFVRCADPPDSDFRFTRNRYCPGRIYVEKDLDESGHDFRCPECERSVFPRRSSKRRHDELRVALIPEGVHRYVAGQLSKAGHVRENCTGVFRVETMNGTMHVCVVEICAETRYLARDHARVLPTLYLCVDEYSGDDRLLKEDWLVRAWLSDVVCGGVRLPEQLNDLARQSAPANTRNLSVAVYQAGPPPIDLAPGASTSAAPESHHPNQATGVRPDGVYPPKTIVFHGREHELELTAQETAFLNVALLEGETPLDALMHSKQGAVWREPYTESKRPAIRSMLKRLNAKLTTAEPPLPHAFRLRRSQNFIQRDEGVAVRRSHSVQ